MDRETIAVLTLTIRLYRKLRQMGIYQMPIELKGIRAKAVKAAQNLDRINSAYDKFNEAAPAHAADVEGLAPQIEALQDDLTFAAQVLGNSVNSGNASGASSGVTGESKPVEATQVATVQKTESAAFLSPLNGHLATSPENHTRDSNGHIIEK